MEVEVIKKKLRQKKETFLDILNDMSLEFLQTEYFCLLVSVSPITTERHDLLCVNDIYLLAFSVRCSLMNYTCFV